MSKLTQISSNFNYTLENISKEVLKGILITYVADRYEYGIDNFGFLAACCAKPEYGY